MTLRRISVTLASNIVTSATNFTVSVAMIASGGPSALGAFTLLAGPWIIGTTLVRGVATQVLLADRRPFRDLAPLVLVVALLGTGFSCLVWALAPSTRVATPVLLGLPFAFLEDSLRFFAFSRTKAHIALLGDSVWLAVVVGALPLTAGDPTAASWAWSVGAAAGCLVMVVFYRSLAGSDGAGGHVRFTYGKSTLLTEAVGTLICGQLLLYGLPLVTSTSTLGLFRFSQTLLMPVGLTSASTLAVALAAGRMDLGAAWRTTVAPAVVGVGMIVVVIAAAPLFDQRLNYPVTAQTVEALVAGVAAVSLSTRNQAVLAQVRGLRRPSSWLPRRLTTSALEPVVGLPAAAVLGLPGAMLGILMPQVAMLGLFRKRYVEGSGAVGRQDLPADV